MKRKIRVGVIFGGRSTEHDVSLNSAKYVMEMMDRRKYNVVPIWIDKKGRWHVNGSTVNLLNKTTTREMVSAFTDKKQDLLPKAVSQQLLTLSKYPQLDHMDVIFPVLHGCYGEDGSIQGLLKLLDIPFVGADVLGSAVGMDKDVMKRLLRDAGIPQADFMVGYKHDISKISFNHVEERLGIPVFIKPANSGSSIGVYKASDIDGFYKAVESAFQYDRKIIIESFICGREIECAVLGNEDPIVSLPGEIVPKHEFYTYDAKYLDDAGAVLEVPADLPREVIMIIQDLAVRTFRVLCCEGLARVDFFLKPNGRIFVNEINTIPGFTRTSMYPKLWHACGISGQEIVDRLIELAIERHHNIQQQQ